MTVRTKWGAKKWSTFKWGGSGVIIGTTSYNETYNTTIEDLLTSQSNTATFGVDNDWANRPQSGQKVEFWVKGKKVFDGRVVTVTPTKIYSSQTDRTDNRYMFTVYAEDYTFDLKKYLVAETYDSDTLYDIVSDIIADYTDASDGITIDATQLSASEPGPTIDRIVLNRVYPNEAFTTVCELVGFDWYIDYNKVLHFFTRNSKYALAPYHLTDGGEWWSELVIEPDDLSEVRNRIYVEGGSYLSAEYQQTVKPEAGENAINLNYQPFTADYGENIIGITVNAAAKTHGIDGVDADGVYDFLVSSGSKTVKCDAYNSGAFAGTETVVITYRYKVPVISVVDGVDSQNRLKALGLGDGVIEYKINDPEIDSLQWADARGYQEIEQYGNPAVHGRIVTVYAGFRSGQVIGVSLTDRGYTTTEYYIIRSVVMSGLAGNEMFQYDIEFSTINTGFDKMLLHIISMQERKATGENDVVNKLIPVIESVPVTDATTTSLRKPPFKWSDDGGTTEGKGQWNESEWS
jgi:hypothetical protein